jgi:hypothetical protein
MMAENRKLGSMASKRAILTMVVLVVLILTTYLAIWVPHAAQMSSRSSVIYSCSSSQSGPYLNLSQVYVCMGLPRIQEQPSNSTPKMINLTTALGYVSSSGGLSNNETGVYYNLVEADFTSGTPPTWDLYFARVYEGFWLYGNYALYSSAFVSVDALTGSIVKVSFSSEHPTPAPTSGTRFEIDVNQSQALQTFRTMSPTKEIPSELISGNVRWIQPMIVMFGPSSWNEAFQTPADPSLSGKERLCWVIYAYSPTPENGYQGLFAVDVETGQIDSAWAMQNFPPFFSP